MKRALALSILVSLVCLAGWLWSQRELTAARVELHALRADLLQADTITRGLDGDTVELQRAGAGPPSWPSRPTPPGRATGRQPGTPAQPKRSQARQQTRRTHRTSHAEKNAPRRRLDETRASPHHLHQ